MTETTGRAHGAGPTDNERDALTATLSRQAFVTEVLAYAKRAWADGHTFGLCLVDLDQFRNINLSHGPACGDDALRDIARRLVRTNLPSVDPSVDNVTDLLVGRYDGDTFSIMVQTSSLDSVIAAAHALHEAVGAVPAVTGSSLTASVGGVLARIGEDVGGVLVRAEQALYLAKQFGRNRVEIGAGPVPLRAGGDVLTLKRSA